MAETRAEKTRRERRFRGDTGELAGLKLAVPENLKKPGHTYRWVNDKADGRIQRMTDRDWDVVKNPAIEGKGEGSPVMRNVGTGEHGKPMVAYLMEKPEDWHKEDQARKQESINAQEEAMRRGPLPSSQGINPAEAYVPSGHNNVIGRSP